MRPSILQPGVWGYLTPELDSFIRDAENMKCEVNGVVDFCLLIRFDQCDSWSEMRVCCVNDWGSSEEIDNETCQRTMH